MTETVRKTQICNRQMTADMHRDHLSTNAVRSLLTDWRFDIFGTRVVLIRVPTVARHQFLTNAFAIWRTNSSPFRQIAKPVGIQKLTFSLCSLFTVQSKRRIFGWRSRDLVINTPQSVCFSRRPQLLNAKDKLLQFLLEMTIHCCWMNADMQHLQSKSLQTL